MSLLLIDASDVDYFRITLPLRRFPSSSLSLSPPELVFLLQGCSQVRRQGLTSPNDRFYGPLLPSFFIAATFFFFFVSLHFLIFHLLFSLYWHLSIKKK
jgi:hypothetical protein